MVQLLPPQTNVGSQFGQALQGGIEQGTNLAGQLLPYLLQRQINKQNYPDADEQPTGQVGISSGPPGTSAPGSAGPTPIQQDQSIFARLTPQQMQADAAAFARRSGRSGAYEERYAQLGKQNAEADSLRKQLLDAAGSQGISPARIPEIFQYARTRPELTNPLDIVAAAKKEFNRVGKIETPGFFQNLIRGPEARENALKNRVPFSQAMKAEGREQEARSSYAENGLTQTEINYQFNPPTPQLEKKIENFPKGIFKPESFGEEIASIAEGRPSAKQYEQVLREHPEIISKQNQRLADFIKENVPQGASLLVLRDQLWRKGYDWHQINDAFNTAFPDKNVLNKDQFSELAEISQAPVASLSDLFGPGFFRRLSAVFQGKR
jgi:hypothetical protein